MKKRIIAVLDTETASLTDHVYDIGMTICDRKGRIIEQYSAIVAETFCDLPTMRKAWYFNKIDSVYAPAIKAGNMVVRPWRTITMDIQILMRKHHVNTVAAYNMSFDTRVIRAMYSRYGGVSIMPVNADRLDIWRLACETLLQQKTFKKLAHTLGWVSKAGNITTSAEVAYRYGLGDWGFIEAHTALADTEIEAAIMAKCFSLNKRVNYGLIGHPWRLVQN